jgi:hypothetical protein
MTTLPPIIVAFVETPTAIQHLPGAVAVIFTFEPSNVHDTSTPAMTTLGCLTEGVDVGVEVGALVGAVAAGFFIRLLQPAVVVSSTDPLHPRNR